MKYRNLSLFFLFSFLISAILSTSISYSLLKQNSISHTKSIVDVDHKKDQNANDFLYEENEYQDEIDFDQICNCTPLPFLLFKQDQRTFIASGAFQKKSVAISPIYLEICNIRV